MTKPESQVSVSPTAVKDLRRETLAGWMDCKKALQASSGDRGKARDWLRMKGLSTAQKKSVREASEGLVASYIHGQGRIGVLLEVNTETDFSARNQSFKSFVKDLSLHIAALQPLYIKEEDIPEPVRQKEKAIFEQEARSQAKTEAIALQIAKGRYQKWLSEVCLLQQEFVRPSEQGHDGAALDKKKPAAQAQKKSQPRVEQALSDLIAKIGENIVIRRFACFVLGGAVEPKRAPS